MQSYIPGNAITLTCTFVNATTQAPANPTTVTLQTLDPEGVLTTYTASGAIAIQNPSIGVFQCTIQPFLTGIWTYRWVGTGAVTAASEKSFEIKPSLFINTEIELPESIGAFALNGQSATFVRT